MPVFETTNDEGQQVLRYRWPARYVTPTDEIYQSLVTWRKEAIRDQELFRSHQRDAAAMNDFALAKFFGAESKYHLRLQRAITLQIPWFGPPDKGQSAERSLLWPIDLARELDEVSNRIVLRFG